MAVSHLLFLFCFLKNPSAQEMHRPGCYQCSSDYGGCVQIPVFQKQRPLQTDKRNADCVSAAEQCDKQGVPQIDLKGMIPEEAETRIVDVDFLREDRQHKTEQNYAKNLHQKHRQGAVVVTGRDPQKCESTAQNGQNCPQGVLLLQKTVEGLSVSAVPHAKGKGDGGIVPPESVGAKTAEVIQAIHMFRKKKHIKRGYLNETTGIL